MPSIQCPHCKNEIYDEDALLCHFCGNSLGRSSAGLLGGMRGAGLKWVWVTLVVVLALAVFLSMI